MSSQGSASTGTVARIRGRAGVEERREEPDALLLLLGMICLWPYCGASYDSDSAHAVLHDQAL